MKTILLFAALACVRLTAIEIEQPEKPEKDDLQELREIQALMVEVHEALRADRTDRTVQMKGKEIEDRLEKIGHEIELQEEREAKQASNPEKPQKPKKTPNQTQIPAQVKSLTPWTALGKEWTHLPAEHRGTMLQTYANEVPARWRKRIAAYFISVQSDETRKEEDAQKRYVIEKEDFDRQAERDEQARKDAAESPGEDHKTKK